MADKYISNITLPGNTTDSFHPALKNAITFTGGATVTYNGKSAVTITIPKNTDTTYPTLTASALTTGTATTPSVVTAKVLNDWLTSKLSTIQPTLEWTVL